jgi:hypothetical protein
MDTRKKGIIFYSTMCVLTICLLVFIIVGQYQADNARVQKYATRELNAVNEYIDLQALKVMGEAESYTASLGSCIVATTRSGKIDSSPECLEFFDALSAHFDSVALCLKLCSTYSDPLERARYLAAIGSNIPEPVSVMLRDFKQDKEFENLASMLYEDNRHLQYLVEWRAELLQAYKKIKPTPKAKKLPDKNGEFFLYQTMPRHLGWLAEGEDFEDCWRHVCQHAGRRNLAEILLREAGRSHLALPLLADQDAGHLGRD